MKRFAITLFTHPGCPGGERCIAYFKEQGLLLELKDIMNDENASREFEQNEFVATPVIIINKKVFIGFDRNEVSSYLQSIG